MPGIYFVGSIFPAYTMTSSHTLRYQECGPCLKFQVYVWLCGDNSFSICGFVLESAARNMKIIIAVVKIFLRTAIFFTYYVPRFIIQICIYKRNRLYISRRKVESSQWAYTWYLRVLLRYLPTASRSFLVCVSHLSRLKPRQMLGTYSK